MTNTYFKSTSDGTTIDGNEGTNNATTTMEGNTTGGTTTEGNDGTNDATTTDTDTDTNLIAGTSIGTAARDVDTTAARDVNTTSESVSIGTTTTW